MSMYQNQENNNKNKLQTKLYDIKFLETCEEYTPKIVTMNDLTHQVDVIDKKAFQITEIISETLPKPTEGLTTTLIKTNGYEWFQLMFNIVNMTIEILQNEDDQTI